jgi:uncharacterized protein involved in type VI secretion and phage assembly
MNFTVNVKPQIKQVVNFRQPMDSIAPFRPGPEVRLNTPETAVATSPPGAETWLEGAGTVKISAGQ